MNTIQQFHNSVDHYDKKVKNIVFIIFLAVYMTACGSEEGNIAPVADAGPDQATTVLVGDVVVLDGSASADANGDPLSYSWELLTFPPGSMAALSDPTISNPGFTADEAGEYIARLTVNDGLADSDPDDVSITVRVPPPVVSITTPENLSVVTANPVTVEGTIDDPTAAITVNGTGVANNNGSYTSSVALQLGSNTITAVGQNGTGEHSTSVEVIFNDGLAPAITFTLPKRVLPENFLIKTEFLAGREFEIGEIFQPASVEVTGVVKVNTSALINAPDVTVNGVAANVSPLIFNSDCPLTFPFRCFNFSATITLERGVRTITAVATDVLSRVSTASMGGKVDYCRIGVWEKAGVLKIWPEPTAVGKDPGVLALAGINHHIQGNRCHEIDGCSAPIIGPLANDPISGSSFNAAPTDFGKGGMPPNEHFVHGLKSRFDLPCNNHDVCYQTCVPVAEREEAWHACNVEQADHMWEVCRRAYPDKCPFTIGNTSVKDPVKCPQWLLEKIVCYGAASSYTKGVESNKGFKRFVLRQEHYCAN